MTYIDVFSHCISAVGVSDKYGGVIDYFIFLLWSQFGLTFSAVFGVIVYRITVSALMAMSPDPETKSNVRVTVTATAVIINLVVILILDEIYGAVAVWLTELGSQIHSSLL